MNKLLGIAKNDLKWFFLRILAYLPTPLPVGLTEFHAWADSIIVLGARYADDDSMKWAMASMIQHLGAQRSSVPKMFFVKALRKGAANQIAAQVFQDIKAKQQEAIDAAKKQAEVTANKEVTPDVQPETQKN